MTVGREDSDLVPSATATVTNTVAPITQSIINTNTVPNSAEKMVVALGGKENIISLDNCVTRLRLSIKNMEIIDEPAIKKQGGIAVVKLDKNTLQVIIGTKVIALRKEMDKYLESC
ncbi:PTS transporter subunit EIIB [Citrobacter sp. KTE151]|uniref:PTS transporter subunit EIIB n=1 Tax=Citrobacter sp. KTE151 TaxID=1169322 RepID=UPI00350F5631